MSKVIEFVSVDLVLQKRIIGRIEKLINAEIEYSELKSQEDTGILYALQEMASNNQVTSVVTTHTENFELTLQELHWLDKHDETDWVDYLVHRYKFRTFPKLQKVANFPPYLLTN